MTRAARNRGWTKSGVCVAMAFAASVAVAAPKAPEWLSQESGECIKCHKKSDPGISQQWGESRHHQAGVA